MSLPVFGALDIRATPPADAADDADAELAWMARAAATGRAGATLWHGRRGLVAPRSYLRLPAWSAACAASAAAGWPVRLRTSGGGIVPQGPEVLNLSLAWCSGAARPSAADAIYAALCERLAAALARLGVRAVPQPVEGAFCDGRYNLAAGGRKLVGTAQSWRRVGGRQMVLAHALVVVDADPTVLTEAANAFERDLGSGREYRADALTSVAAAWRAAHREAPPPDLESRLTQALAETFARMIEPHEAA